MLELIDRQSALSVCKEYGWIDDEDFIEGYNTAIKDIREAIKELPATETKPVRHGWWILCEDQSGVDNDNNNYAYLCSQCHHQDVHSTNAEVNFCWNCGAKMDEDMKNDGSKTD